MPRLAGMAGERRIAAFPAPTPNATLDRLAWARLRTERRGMGVRVGGFREAYRVAHAAGWDAGNRRMAAAGRAEWDAADFDHAAATFQAVIHSLGFGGPAAQAEGGPALREGVPVH